MGAERKTIEERRRGRRINPREPFTRPSVARMRRGKSDSVQSCTGVRSSSTMPVCLNVYIGLAVGKPFYITSNTEGKEFGRGY